MRRPILASLPFLLASACSRGDSSLPEAYRRLEVPVARLGSADARERGAGLFAEHCALCHGARADGQGQRREGLSTSPKNFSDPAWRERTSPRAVFFAIREGIRGSAMPAWRSLGDEDVWDLVAFVLSVGEDEPKR
jgi:mono/diheme cytochrome c family protein